MTNETHVNARERGARSKVLYWYKRLSYDDLKALVQKDSRLSILDKKRGCGTGQDNELKNMEAQT